MPRVASPRSNLAVVPYTTADARQQLLDSIVEAGEALGAALASLTEAYELLDENAAERLEEQLFRPVQSAYARARRTQSEFAERYELPGRSFEPAVRGAPSHGVKGFLEAAVQAIGEADLALATLQDSMLPIEVGDPELRAGLEQVRTLIGPLAGRAHELVRNFGR
jgi:hypothetical protein